MDDIIDEEIIDICIDTYAVLIMGMDAIDYSIENGGGSFLFDPTAELEDTDKMYVCSIMLTVFEEFEHYEKCQDIKEYMDGI